MESSSAANITGLFERPFNLLRAIIRQLQVEEAQLERNKAAQSAPHITTSVTKKRQQVIVVGNSLWRGIEVPICPFAIGTHSLERCVRGWYQGHHQETTKPHTVH